MEIRTNRLSAKFVAPTPTFGLRDWSSEWDDTYEGVVRFAVVAE